jgi:hypothetical protein
VVELGQLLDPAALGLDGLHVGDGRRHLAGGQREERPVLLVELQVRAGAQNQRPHRGRLPGDDERQDHSRVDVVIPGRTCAAPGEPGKELREAGHDLDLPRGDRGPRAVRDDAGG